MPEAAKTKSGPVESLHSPHALWKTLQADEVRLNEGFWTGRQAVNRKASLRHAFEMLKKNGNLHNLRLAAGLIQGEYRGRNFLDSDVYKWLEAVAWELGNAPDAELQRMADEAIAMVGAAQRPDGYINSYVQVTGAYAPFEDPEIIVMAFAYNGGEGASVAAPIVARVLQAYFELKAIDIAQGGSATP